LSVIKIAKRAIAHPRTLRSKANARFGQCGLAFGNDWLSGRGATTMIRVNRRIEIDENELEWEFIRASGPGGQNVNKVSTAVRLRWRVVGSDALPGEVRDRLIRLAGKRIGEDGFLTIHARTGRTQESNRREAIERLVELVQRACEKPKPRKATKPTAASQKRRLEAKKRRSRTKDLRRGQNHANE
jgi:ribosome-associated protein